MPEMKKQFTKGKMNKDLDERLVPNGEYRDAMNIQVATSEDGDVATVQNVLGNEEVIIGTKFAAFEFPPEARVIASVSDEKVDTLYWFVWTPEVDYILFFENNKIPGFVFVDVNKDTLKFSERNYITGINVIDGMIFWTDNESEPKKINIKRCIEGTQTPTSSVSGVVTATQTKLINEATLLTNVGGPTSVGAIDMQEKHVTVIKKSPPKPMGMQLEGVRDDDLVYTAVMTVEIDDDGPNDSSLNFSGIDSPNVTNTDQSDMYSFSAAAVGDVIAIKLEQGINSAGQIIDLGDIRFPGGDPLQPGGLPGLTGWHTSTGNSSIEPGTKLVIQRFDDVDDPPGIPITDFAIKGQVVDRESTTGSTSTTHNNAIYFEITNIVGFPPEPDASLGEENLQLAVDLFDETEKLFEFKFPRFSYRYKYEDGEYSPFAPFTQVAFVPGAFDYHPRKGYNIGMTNTIKSISLNRFLNKSIPQDIVSVDILFKDEPSTAVYVVDTLTPLDKVVDSNGLNKWETVRLGGSYRIEKETVNNILQENQLLRPWDNVPRRALAQDITGNRVVYANYVQNYNMVTQGGEKYYPEFKTNWKYFPSTVTEANRSCKSLREYQLGVVFVDKHGRETPVISNSTGTMKLDKTSANKSNRIQVGLRGDATNEPVDLSYFKFFVKETSNEYYNLAMDRWYFAEDSNVWLSFPSTERNKIDLESFLILKKGSDQDTLVEEAARYKVLAIESEAPDFIKTKPLLVSDKTHIYASAYDDATDTFLVPGSPLFPTDLDNAPLVGKKEFQILYNLYKSSPGRDLHNYLNTGLGELYIEFAHVGEEEVSQRYKINSITCTNNPDTTSTLETDTYNIRLEKQLGTDVNFITDDPTGLDPSEIINGTIVRFYKYEVINAAQFDGRFFVKIYMDDIFKQNIEKSFKTELGFRIVEEEMFYYLKEDWFEQFTQHMDWWFTPGFQDTQRGGPGVWESIFNQYQGTRKAYSTLGRAYGYEDYDEPPQYGFDSSNLHMGDIYQLLRQGPPMKQHGGGTSVLNAFRGGDAMINTDSDGNLIKYGHYTNDKFCASALYFRRFKPYPYQSFDQVGDYNLNLRWTYCTFNGGDRKNPNNWDVVPLEKCEAFWGVGSHFDFYDADGSGYREAVIESVASDIYNDEDNRKACRDAEVWFIDNGRAQGRRTTSNALTLKGNINWDSIHENNFSCNKTGDAGGPYGIKNYNSSDEQTIYLGYGGIYGMQPGIGNGFQEMFGIGGWNGQSVNPFHDSGDIVNLISRINPGYRFKWREDPTNTVYLIGPNISEHNYINHSTYEGDDNLVGQSLQIKRHQASKMPVNMDPCISHNYRKNFVAKKVKPAVVWNPLHNGQIPGGIDINLTICNSNGSETNPANITDGSVNGPDGTSVKIYVKSLSGADANYGVKKLHEGMALKKFEGKSDGAGVLGQVISTISGFNDSGDIHKGNDFLVVTTITPKPNSQEPTHYELKLGGYNFPMQNDDHSWLQGSSTQNHPKVGGSYNFVQVGMNGHNSNTEFNINTCGYAIGSKVNNQKLGKMGAVGYKLQFVEEIQPEEILSENPAIWETEPKDAKDLDIYYEATGAIPFSFDASNVHEAFPIGSFITTDATPGTGNEILYVNSYVNERIVLNEINVLDIDDPSTANIDESVGSTGNFTSFFTNGNVYKVTTPSGLTFGVEVTNVNFNQVTIDPRLYNSNFQLPWHNCYSFGNGVESNRIRDNFNQPFITNGVKASTTLAQEYKEERRKYGLIYSGIYNSVAGVNDLNQFIQAEKITKDINPIYGSIQKLHSRDSDLVTLCEDKVLKIQANKDALFNADGNTNVTASSNVLGQAIPFSGEYGISTNPESFASEAYRAYFSDKVRGKVIRLSMDGLTPISDYGMTDWFKDNLKLVPIGDDENDIPTGRIIGSYDDRNDEYNIKLETKEQITDTEFEGKVITFSEKVKGWVSFKSFNEMENALSMANDYYTFRRGRMFKHYSEDVDRNTFYGVFQESSIDVMLNDVPSAVKVFNTLNYEGSQSKIDKFIDTAQGTLNIAFQPQTVYTDQEYYNLSSKDGWYVEDITTNKETGKINEFIEKEGKWFNAISKVVDINTARADTADFTFQGIGLVGAAGTVVTGGGGSTLCPAVSIEMSISSTQGVTTSAQLDFSIPPPVQMSTSLGGYDTYDFTITPPSGSILTGSTGTVPTIGHADIVSAGTGTWEFSVTFEWEGITNCTSSSSMTVKLGCMDPNSQNYNANANVPDGSCIPHIYGCTNPFASNFNSNATIDDGSCLIGTGPVGGADDPVDIAGDLGSGVVDDPIDPIDPVGPTKNSGPVETDNPSDTAQQSQTTTSTGITQAVNNKKDDDETATPRRSVTRGGGGGY